eukprot:s755_g9.t2
MCARANLLQQVSARGQFVPSSPRALWGTCKQESQSVRNAGLAMMRPPSREDVQTAQSHLVLLKSKMRQRRQQASIEVMADPRLGRPPSGRTPAEKSAPRGVTWITHEFLLNPS